MKVIPTAISNVLVFKPKVFEDNRGYFFEAFNENVFSNIGIDKAFVQDNQSLSEKNVLRGMHFQEPPFDQGKLVRVIKGAVLDVALDIRKNSPTYGKWVSQVLSEQNKLMMWIPSGFAHGFLTLENNTIFFYKCTGFYNSRSEGIIMWNDTHLNIDWNISNPIISERDQQGQPFNNFVTPFE
ncbi:MAG: dTDP-4-dehydrorhamnose 3,5-epimerase [Bacteroidota bacterium]